MAKKKIYRMVVTKIVTSTAEVYIEANDLSMARDLAKAKAIELNKFTIDETEFVVEQD